jgi:hypothetical protein
MFCVRTRQHEGGMHFCARMCGQNIHRMTSQLPEQATAATHFASKRAILS